MNNETDRGVGTRDGSVLTFLKTELIVKKHETKAKFVCFEKSKQINDRFYKWLKTLHADAILKIFRGGRLNNCKYVPRQIYKSTDQNGSNFFWNNLGFGIKNTPGCLKTFVKKIATFCKFPNLGNAMKKKKLMYFHFVPTCLFSCIRGKKINQEIELKLFPLVSNRYNFASLFMFGTNMQFKKLEISFLKMYRESQINEYIAEAHEMSSLKFILKCMTAVMLLIGLHKKKAA